MLNGKNVLGSIQVHFEVEQAPGNGHTAKTNSTTGADPLSLSCDFPFPIRIHKYGIER